MTESTNLLKPEEVEFLLDQAVPEAEKPGKTTAATADPLETPVTMRGDLEQINLADIFQTLGVAKMMGVLQVSNPLERRHVFFSDGFARIVVPARVAIRRLGQRLVQGGVLQPEQLRMALLEQRRAHAPLGQILIQQGLASEEQINEVIAQQLSEELFTLFTWRHGEFEFYRGEVADPDLRRRIEDSPEFEINGLLLEVARRTDEWAEILAAIGSLDEILTRCAPELPAGGDVGETHRVVFASADGQQTLREIAESNILTLFDAARAARDLVAANCLCLVPEQTMLQIAKARAESGHKKPALMLVQALRSREGSKSPEVTRSLADVMKSCGEPRLAGRLLLETAQAQTNSGIALDLARAANQLATRDPEILSFLRTTLIGASSLETGEVEAVTITLLDTLIEDGKCDIALQIIDETVSFGTTTPQILVRKVRALQKAQQHAAAVDLLVEIAQTHLQKGERARALDSLQQALKIDRERKDVQKLLKQLTQSRQARRFRIVVAVATTIITLGGGFEYLRRRHFDRALLQATEEVTGLIAKNDNIGARAALATWSDKLGDCEQLVDLQRQIRFSEVSVIEREKRDERRRDELRMAEAGRALQDGSVVEAYGIYATLHQKPELSDQVVEVASMRTDALTADFERLGKSLPISLPPPPTRLMEARQIEEQQKSLGELVKPSLRRAAREVGELVAHDGLPQFLPADRRARLTQAVETLMPHLIRADARLREFVDMLTRMDIERRLDPLLRSADEKERRFDFRAALADYEQLVAEVPEGDVRQHFRGKIARCRDVATRIENVAKATAAGDFAAARAGYLASKQQNPGIPFDRIMRLPLHIRTDPPGAAVLVNGVEAGKSPLRFDYSPASQVQVELRLPGYQTETAVVTGAELATLHRTFAMVPTFTMDLAGVVERTAAVDAEGQVYTVDRAGCLTAISVSAGAAGWRWTSKDLSGLLTAPLVHADLVLFGSLDGEFRALRRGPGTLAWSQAELPAERNPALVGDRIVLATTTGKLVVLEAGSGRVVDEVALPEPVQTDVLISNSTVLVGGADGNVVALALSGLALRWQKRAAPGDDYELLVHGNHAIVLEGGGRMTAFATDSGDVVWQRVLPGEPVGQASRADSLLVALADRVLVIDPSTGETRKTLAIEGRSIQAGPVLLPGGFVVRRRDGRATAHSIEDGRTLFQIVGTRPITAISALNDGILATYADRRASWFASR